MKRQVSERELLAIRVGVGLTVTILIYALSVVRTCGFSQVFSVIFSQFKMDFLFYGVFFYIPIFCFNFFLFYNFCEFLLWRRGVRSNFVPKYPPSETNSDWIIFTKEEWIAAMNGRFFLRMPLWFLFVAWIFSHHAERFCPIP
jgi:hypothetical protein